MKPTPPMLSSLPVVGNALEFRKDRHALFRRGYETLGPVFGIKLANQPAAVLIGPEYHQTFFMETDKKLSMHKTYKFLAAIFGKIAFTASPEVYQAQRPILHAPFKREKMLKYVEVMQEEVQAWLDSLGEAGEFELNEQLTVLIQHVAAHAFMGRDFRYQMGREFWDLYKIIGRALDPILPPNLPLPRFIRRDQAKEKMRAMLRPILAERRQNPEKYDDFLQDFINTPHKDGTKADDETILGLILGLMFAGHETTSGQAAWTVIQLLQHPDYLQTVLQEIDTVLPPGTAIQSETLRSLKHIEWAVRETERMHPSADILLRLAEEEIEVGDYRIPPGWVVFVSSAIAHRLPEVFKNPNQYDPLRFGPERAEDAQHRFALIGFGGGVHKCTGMNFAYNEMMVITALLFQQFELELLSPDPQVEFGLGATRPTPTRIRYQRKTAPEAGEKELSLSAQ